MTFNHLRNFNIDQCKIYLYNTGNYGKKHPDTVVETSSLSSIKPPEVLWENVQMPKDLVKDGKMSEVQLEAVCYASQRHKTFLGDNSRAGYLIGWL